MPEPLSAPRTSNRIANCYAPHRVRSRTTAAGDDRFWVLSLIHGPDALEDGVRLPFYVDRAGYSLWTRRTWSWERCPIFGIELVTGGDALFVQDGRRSIVRPGEAFLVRIGSRQQFGPGPSGRLHKRFAYITGPLAELTARTMGLCEVDVVRRPSVELMRLIREACRILETTDTPRECSHQLSRVALDLMITCAQSLRQETMASPVRDTINYINSHLSGALRLDDLARHAGISQWHFSRLFRRQTGTSPMQYVQKRRMEYAAAFLRSTGLLIKEIAALMGFDDPAHFSTQFKAVMGVSPRRFRRAPPA